MLKWIQGPKFDLEPSVIECDRSLLGDLVSELMALAFSGGNKLIVLVIPIKH